MTARAEELKPETFDIALDLNEVDWIDEAIEEYRASWIDIPVHIENALDELVTKLGRARGELL